MIGLNECKLFKSGAAPISPDVKSFFLRFDIPLAEVNCFSESRLGLKILVYFRVYQLSNFFVPSQVFGMTETSGSFISPAGLTPELLIHGCGKPAPTMKVKIHQPNENNIGEVG